MATIDEKHLLILQQERRIMGRWQTFSLANSRAARRGLAFRSTSSRRSRLAIEPLEDRRLLTASLSLAGTQTLVAGTNIDASADHATQQQNMSIDINPINPLHVAGVSERNTPTTGTSLGLYRSLDGGASWTTTTIDNAVDGFGTASTRFDPVLGYDATGKLYVAYGVNDSTTTRLVVLVSSDDGATFTQTTTVDSIADLVGSLNRFNLATGPDGLGKQAVYVAYSKSTGRLETTCGRRLQQWRRQFYRARVRRRYFARHAHQRRSRGWTGGPVVRFLVQRDGRRRQSGCRQ